MVSARTYRLVALEDPEGHWELHRGRLREKPSLTFRHNDEMAELGFMLRQQLDRDVYRIRVNAGRLSRTDETVYIPDVAVLPLLLAEPFRDRSDVLEVYDEPLPFVAELWSPSTGGYDIADKLPEYRRRGDAEIWHLRPFDRMLMVWRRQPDGEYAEETYRGGIVPVASLPGVTIDLDALLAR